MINKKITLPLVNFTPSGSHESWIVYLRSNCIVNPDVITCAGIYTYDSVVNARWIQFNLPTRPSFVVC